MIHYLHVTNGVPDAVTRGLPRVLESVAINPDDGLPWVNRFPREVEAAGDLHLYGWYKFDSTDERELVDGDFREPLLLTDCTFVGGVAAGVHRISTRTRLERRIERLATAREKWAQADWTAGPAWTTYKTALRDIMSGLIANTLAPADVVWPTPPGNLEIP